MSRYQQEVADMDRRHALLVRAASFAGVAGLIVVALWSAEVKLPTWLSGAQKSLPAHQAEQPTAPEVPVPSLDQALQVKAPRTPDQASPDSPGPQRLVLVSTSPGRDAHSGTASIGTNPSQPQTYLAGAILANGSRIAEIHAEHVVLERGRDREILYVMARGDGVSRSAHGASDLAIVDDRSVAQPKIKPVRDHLIDVIRSMPYYENDAVSGIQIFPGQKSSVFAQLGLQPGDVIVAIDGAPVGDAGDATETLRTLTLGASLSVRILRSRQAITVSLHGAIVTEAMERDARTESPVAPPPS